MTMKSWHCDSGDGAVIIKAKSAQAAAESYILGGEWGDIERSLRFVVIVAPWRRNKRSDVEESWHRVVLHPTPPPCSRKQGHRWVDPGGNSIWASGPGIKSHGVCAHCGVRKITDTGAQDPCSGEYFTSIRYEEK